MKPPTSRRYAHHIPWMVQLWRFDKAGAPARDASWRYMILDDALDQADRLSGVVGASRGQAGVTVFRVGSTLGPIPTPLPGKVIRPVDQ
jgi:hypothetical protein